MNANEIVEQLKNHKGQHVPACWQTTLKTRANVNVVVTKRTTCFVRAGIDYANLKSVKEGIENGERGEVQPLPWGEWEEFPFIIRHTPKGATEVKRYVRLYPAVFENLKAKMEVEYTIDGVPATKEQCVPLCLASAFPEREEPAKCFNPSADAFLSIG